MKVFLLSNAKLNILYKIKKLNDKLNIKTKTRLLELGFLCDTPIMVTARSLSGGVLLVQINNSILTLRKKEANLVEIG